MADVALSAAKEPDEEVRAEVLRNELRSETPGGALGAVLIIGSVSYIGMSFWSVANRPAMILWLSFFAILMSLWAWSSIRKLTGRWRVFEPSVEARRSRVVITLANIGIAVSVPLLMPVAEPAMRTTLLVMYLWYVGVQLLAATEATQMALSGVVLVIGSIVALVLIEGRPGAIELSIVLILFGATMLLLRRFLRTAVVTAAAERARSERARVSLADALGVVAAERDSKTRFIEAASHDLQQPLQAASLYLEQALGAGDGAQRDRAAAGVRKALASTHTLLETMLDHLRLEAGAAPVRIGDVRVGDLIEDVMLEHGAAASAAGMRIRLVEGGSVVRADGAMLRRALGNLVANAIRHSRGEKLLVGARRRGEAIELWVIDDGDGIGEADVPTLFETFARGRHARTAGFGIGLASTRAAIELMGGQIALDRRWTAGSAFRITLPRFGPGVSVERMCEAV